MSKMKIKIREHIGVSEDRRMKDRYGHSVRRFTSKDLSTAPSVEIVKIIPPTWDDVDKCSIDKNGKLSVLFNVDGEKFKLDFNPHLEGYDGMRAKASEKCWIENLGTGQCWDCTGAYTIPWVKYRGYSDYTRDHKNDPEVQAYMNPTEQMVKTQFILPFARDYLGCDITESKKSESEDSLDELIDKVDNMFHYHNKNLNNYQYNTIDDLLEALKSKDTDKIKEAIRNLDNLVHYRNKNLNKSQYYLLDELLEALQAKYKKAEESKKSEGVSGTIKMNIDYNTFMRLLDAAAFLDADEDYKDALWDYYSEMGEIGGEAFVFFDNLFQYTSWYDVDEMYDEIGERFQDESKSKEECIQDAIDDVDMAIYQYKDHYLVIQ